MVDQFLTILPKDPDVNLNDDYLNRHDSAHGTPLCHAVTKDYYVVVQQLLRDKRTNILAKVKCDANEWGSQVDIDHLSWRNGFKSNLLYVLK